MSSWHLPRFSRTRAWGLKCVVGRQARTIIYIEERGVQVLQLWRIESYGTLLVRRSRRRRKGVGKSAGPVERDLWLYWVHVENGKEDGIMRQLRKSDPVDITRLYV